MVVIPVHFASKGARIKLVGPFQDDGDADAYPALKLDFQVMIPIHDLVSALLHQQHQRSAAPRPREREEAPRLGKEEPPPPAELRESHQQHLQHQQQQQQPAAAPASRDRL